MDGTVRCDKKCDLADRYNLENAEILCGLILDTIEGLLSPSSDGELEVVFPARYWPKLSKESSSSSSSSTSRCRWLIDTSMSPATDKTTIKRHIPGAPSCSSPSAIWARP